jgi:acyl transferase domain-containing protein/NADP-dependent 3-hydroxy acid dehydrogenase YdfG
VKITDRTPTAAPGPRTAGHEPLAIIGMAVRLPGADDLDAYWRLVVEGRSAIGELPAERLDRELFFDPAQGVRGKTYSSIGGIVAPRPEPPPHWLLAPAQAADCDAAHLELCDVVAAAFRHAGFDPLAVPHRRAGVYVGHTRGTGLGGDLMYAAMLADTAAWLGEVEGFADATGGDAAGVIEAVVARERARLPRRTPNGGPRLDAQRCSSTISQAFGLDGPCVALNAACSSSLFALATAADDLLLGRSDMAVVAGSSHCRFDSLVLFSKAQSVSATGSRPFDASADGLVTAEGYVVVLVKTLRRALADGNPVHAVIRGIGVSSDGRGKSLWAPREEGQTEAIRRAHADLLDPARLGYVEAHATSTSVGDATEVKALARALREHVSAGRRIPIGSVKANIGHTLETAGLAGLVKAVLCMRHATIPPMPGVEALNPDVDWEASPFRVPREPQPWPAADGLPRRVAVNSFGIGGLNAHVVLDEFTGSQPAAIVETSTPLAATAFAAVPADDAVAIVGLAALAPGALSAGALWDLVGGDTRPFTPVPPGRWNVAAAFDPGPATNWRTPQKLGGFIEGFAYDWRSHKIPPKQIAAADPLQFMLLDTVSKALADAGHPDRPLPQARTGVVVGTVFGGDFAVALQVGMRLPFFRAALDRELTARGVPADRSREIGSRFADLVIERLPALADETGSFTSSSLASRITKTFDLMGGATAIDGGAASAVAALDVCRNFLLTGRVDCMICAAGQRSMSLATFEQLALSGWLSRSGRPRAFDDSSDGLLPAEGTAVFVLKRLSDARRAGDRIHAIIRGLGTARAASPALAVRMAIERSLAEAGLPPGAVAAVEAAAAGVAATDRAELEGIQGIYGTTTPVGTLAPRIGHALGASAGLSLVKTACELEAVRLRDAVASTPDAPLEPTPDGRLLIGLDSLHLDTAHHVLLERGTPVPEDRRPQRTARSAAPAAPVALVAGGRADDSWHAAADASCRLVRISAATVSELLAAADACADDPRASFAAAAPGAPGGFTGSGHRLAIVARSADELAAKARLVTSQFEHPESRGLWETRGIAVGEVRGRRPLVACLFPGQGSQYPGMLRDVVVASAAAAAARATIDAALEPLGFPSFEAIVDDADGQLGHDVFRTQLAMLVADTIQFAVLAELGLTPDRVTGHSYGEFAALHAAGAWDFATAARATFLRCQAICEAPAVNGVMLSCAADEEVVAAACAAVGGDVFVSNCNSAQQTVVGGRREQVVALAGVLGTRGVTTRLLEVPRPFHTPLMQEAESPFRAALAGVRIDPPRIPLLSSVHNRYVAEPADIRELLVGQLTRPVRYIAQIERLIDEGVEVFVEAGPERVLAKLTRRIVGDRPQAVIATDVRSRSPRDEGSAAVRLAAVRGALEVTGAIDPAEEQGFRRPVASPVPNPASPPADRADHAEHAATHPVPSPAAEPAAPPNDERAGLIMLAGTPADMGFAHGRRFAAEIRDALTLLADLPPAAGDRLLDPATVLDTYETMTTPEQREELRGIAAGAGVAYESLVAMHVRIDPSLEGGCVQAVFPAAVTRTGRLLQGANEDLPAGLVLRDGIRRCVQLRRPSGRLASVTFTATGVSCGINGMNETGLVVTSSMLLDQPPRSGPRRGLMHSALVDRVLSTARSAAEAVSIIRDAPRDGAWAMLVSEGDGGRMLHVEYDARTVREAEVREPVCLANHSRLGLGTADVPAHSRARLDRLEQLVTPARCTATAEAFSMMLRDRFDVARQSEVRHATMNTIQRVDNQASVVFDPQARRVLCTVRRPDDGRIEFREIDCRDWFERPAVVAAAAAPPPPAQAAPAQAAPAQAAPPRATPPRAAPARPAREAEPPVLSAADYARLGTSVEGRSPVDASERICTRFLVRLVPWPLADAAPRPLAGRAVVVGTGAVADACARRLAAAGVEPLRAATAADPACLAAIDDLTADCSQLYLLDPLADPPLGGTAADWQTARDRLLDRYRLVQRWFTRHEQAGSLPAATLVAATSLGTPGGIADATAAPIAGGITGLVKGIHTEERERRLQGFHAVVVDVPTDAVADDVAGWLLAEAGQASENPEIVYAAGRRHAVRPVNVPLPGIPAPPAATLAGAWVITGGARGVTAQVARGLGAVPGTVLHLVGSSPVPEVPEAWRDLDDAGLRRLREGVMREALARRELPADAWGRIEKAIEIDATLAGLAAEGIRATYHACDVGDRAALGSLLERIRRADGPIRGVIHGAGFEKASRFSRKKAELVDRTIRAKVDGAVHLMDATAADPLAAFVVFGSISGRFGAVGQTDYCTANECVAKLVRWYRGRRPEVPAVVVAWHSWDEVGMAVRPESKFSKSLLKLRFMPPGEGVEHLLAEIAAGCPEAEVVITDWRYFKLRHPDPLWLPPAVPPPVASPGGVGTSTPSSAALDSRPPAPGIRRHVLRLVAAPRPAGDAGIPGPVLVVGRGTDADAVVARLGGLGLEVDRLATDADAADAGARLDTLLAAGRARSLLLLTAREIEACDIARASDWAARRSAGVVAPFLLVQRWFAHHARARQPAVLAAAVALGGDFGISGQPRAPEGAAVAGLLKAARIEAAARGWHTLGVAVVDAAPALSPARRAADFVAEAAASGDAGDAVEIAFDALGERQRLDVVAADVPAAAVSPPRAGAAWVAVGGARGITARMALHLARRFGVHMHLIGAGPLPTLPAAWRALDADGRSRLKQEIAAAAVAAGESPAARWLPIERALDIDATLAAFAAAGLRATYHACDASDPAALRDVLDRVRAADGPIEGVIQGAGAFERSRLEAKTIANLERLLAAKLDATHALVTLTREDPLRFFVALGSVAGRFGTNGNADYALASDMQCGLMGWLRSVRPEVHAVGFHWHPWDETGMMMRSASFASREIMKLALLPPADGVVHLERELLAGAPEPQVVITDDGYRAWLARTVRGADRPQAPAAAPAAAALPRRPLVDAILAHEPGRRLVAECLLDPTAEPFLVEHRFRGRPLLPFVIALELLAEAAATLVPGRALTGFDEVEIVSGLKFVHDRPVPVRMRASLARDGVEVELVSDFMDRRGRVLTSDRVHVRGRIALAAAELPAERLEPPGDWWEVGYPEAREEIIYHGPQFRRITGASLRDGIGWMRLAAESVAALAGRRPTAGWILSPAMLDACFFGCGLHVWLETQGVVAIPNGVRKLRCGRLPEPGEICVERIRRVSRSSERAVFDFVLAGADGRVILAAEGFEAAVLTGMTAS